jgi:hypothetical protein
MSQSICRYLNEFGSSIALIPIYLARYLSGKAKNALLQLNQTSAFTLRTLSMNPPSSTTSATSTNNNNNNNNIVNNTNLMDPNKPSHSGSSFTWESLKILYNDLISEERLKEALSLRQHMEVLEQISKAEKMYENSKLEDRLEEALEIKKIVERLQKKLINDMEIRRWASPAPKNHLTISSISSRIHQSNNPVIVRFILLIFVNHYV